VRHPARRAAVLHFTRSQTERNAPPCSVPVPNCAGRAGLRRQIEATDGEIDRLVYDLYGLTADEIRIVEGAVAAGPTADEDSTDAS